ncbi:hypothetical protein OG563_00240 [Nocardia vinacea]|uniref:Integral membrane protein n=1 Tax=Nocardia vinacea TaxID=96468 RepID=A0ABZ1YUM8_9NOCA|nr:hypothetical protein [Nocardia vinacea]
MELSEAWLTYFEVVALVAGAILALLFVGLQVGFERWNNTALRIYVAATTLLELASPLTISMFALLPGNRWWLACFIVATIGLASVVGHGVVYGMDWYGRKQIKFLDHFQMWASVAISTTVYTLVLLSGLWRDDPTWLVVAGYACIWLIISGMFESWLLVTLPTDGVAPGHVAADVKPGVAQPVEIRLKESPPPLSPMLAAVGGATAVVLAVGAARMRLGSKQVLDR